MESAVEAKSDPVGEKRPAVDGDVSRDASPAKRIRGRSAAVDVKKVAEMVLVLAAMGKMRGGKGPTDVEKGLMAEARDKLAKVCEGFAPKDVFPRDAFGSVIEDLGLNKLKEQRLGFRPPKMSISEKLLVSKRKMEEAESFSLPSTTHAARLQGNSATAVDNRSASHPVRMSQPEKPGRMPITSGSFQSPSPLTQNTSTNSASLLYQLPTSEIRPVVSSALPSSHLTSTTLQRVDRPHLRPDGKSNGPSQSLQVPATYSANSTGRTPTWSVQPQNLSSKSGSDNKVQVNMSLKVEGAAGVRSGIAPQTSRTIAQTKGGPGSLGSNSVQPPPLVNNHAEIGKIVQKLLQPKVLERPTWIPPSMDYMNKALTCQICMSTVTEIDSILICDACEKGYHLKCLQATNLKGVPRGEWHCGKCLSTSNGKPLPPKYGRVMRNVHTQKVSSNPTAVQPTANKIVGVPNEKNSQAKVLVNGNTTMDKALGVAAKISGPQISVSEAREATGTPENDIISSMSKMDLENKASDGACPNNMTGSSNSAAVPSVNTLIGKESEEKVTELKPNSSAEVVMAPKSSDMSQASGKADEANPEKKSIECHHIKKDSKESQGDDSTNNTNPPKEQGFSSDYITGNAASNGSINSSRSSSTGLHAVIWIGDPVRIVDEKMYYESCIIVGTIHKLMDHVLIRSENGKLIPSKIQAMWEDKNTSTKWVTVNQCYFPSDLPEAVGRPCGLESSEVYESTRGRAFAAGLIEGRCEVLPPRRFAEEFEWRAQLGKHVNQNLPPLYLCKWIYDEEKGLYRDISC